MYGILCYKCNIECIPIFMNYLDNKTLTVYLTNVLFLTLKLVDAYSTVKTDKNIFYSAYLSSKVQFNDVDPDKCFIEESKQSLSVKEETPVENKV